MSNISSYFPIDLTPATQDKEEDTSINKDWWMNPQPNKNPDPEIKERQYYIAFYFVGDKNYVKKFIFKNREERDYCLKELDESIHKIEKVKKDCSSFRASSALDTLIVFIPSFLAGFKLMPRSSRKITSWGWTLAC